MPFAAGPGVIRRDQIDGNRCPGGQVWLALVTWVWRTERKGNGHVG
jgi:hypothetical protein